MFEWIQSHKVLLGWLGAVSITAFLGTLIVVPWLVVRIPSEYFIHQKCQRQTRQRRHPVIRIMMMIGKNMLGYVFLVAGILMLMLPGQGIITLFMGIMFLDFPGKYRFERWIISHKPVLRSINWLRHRAGRRPLIITSSHSLTRPCPNPDRGK